MGEEIRSRISRDQNKLDKPYLCLSPSPHAQRAGRVIQSLGILQGFGAEVWADWCWRQLFSSNARALGLFWAGETSNLKTHFAQQEVSPMRGRIQKPFKIQQKGVRRKGREKNCESQYLICVKLVGSKANKPVSPAVQLHRLLLTAPSAGHC